MRNAKKALPTWAVVALIIAVLYLEYRKSPDSPPGQSPAVTQPVSLKSVIDGDTLDVRTPGGETLRVRLLGIDCMETYQQEKMKKQARRLNRSMREIESFGLTAKKRLRDLISRSELQIIQPEGWPTTDPYGRRLGYLEADGQDAGVILLEAGLAEARREPHPRSSEYAQANKKARQTRQGIYAK